MTTVYKGQSWGLAPGVSVGQPRAFWQVPILLIHTFPKLVKSIWIKCEIHFWQKPTQFGKSGSFHQTPSGKSRLFLPDQPAAGARPSWNRRVTIPKSGCQMAMKSKTRTYRYATICIQVKSYIHCIGCMLKYVNVCVCVYIYNMFLYVFFIYIRVCVSEEWDIQANGYVPKVSAKPARHTQQKPHTSIVFCCPKEIPNLGASDQWTVCHFFRPSQCGPSFWLMVPQIFCKKTHLLCSAGRQTFSSNSRSKPLSQKTLWTWPKISGKYPNLVEGTAAWGVHIKPQKQYANVLPQELNMFSMAQFSCPL